MSQAITIFPLAAIVVSITALHYPGLFIDLKWAIIPLLAIIMFGMGATLSADDFKRVLSRPLPVIAGIVMQFTLMPMIAWILSLLLQLPAAIMAGLVVVGACPGGTASNVICYLAKGNVALSITMTACSTLLAVLLTPFITWLYLGQSIDVPVLDMMKTIFMIIVIPVSFGMVCNNYLGLRFSHLKRFLPVVSMTAIVVIIGIIIALNASRLESVLMAVIVAVVLHNLIGLLCGYALSRLVGFDRTTCKTIAIEVGMQNSGLGVALAGKYFSPAAALPGALFSIWHNISGALLASYWSRQKQSSSAQTTGASHY